MTDGSTPLSQVNTMFDTTRYDAASTQRSQAALRTILATHFHVNRLNWKIATLSRQRIAVDHESWICDLAILDVEAPIEPVVRVPPMICIDIIAEEPLALIQSRIDMYERLGVKQIWLLDPVFRSAWKAGTNGLFQIKNDEMGIPGTSIGFRISTIYAELDELVRPVRRSPSPSTVIDRQRPSTETPTQGERNRRSDR